MIDAPNGRGNAPGGSAAEFDMCLRLGLCRALEYLNGRTRHRFTGVYCFDPPMLRSVALHDRENPSMTLACDVPMVESYCSIVGAHGARFATGDASADARLRAHPARRLVLAYSGTPLFAANGQCLGSLCHFDERPRLVPVEEIPLLEHAAREISVYVEARLPAVVQAGVRIPQIHS